MSPKKALSKAEMEMVRMVWELEQATVREVCDALPKDRELDFTTVQTYLVRLEDKGYLRSKKVGRAKVFRAAARPADVIREAVEDFVGRLFGGESLPLVRHLVEDQVMSPEQIEELRELLDQSEETKDESKRGKR